MADFMKSGDNYKISISRWYNSDQCTFYVVELTIGEIWWSVTHRYSDFVELHEVLVSDHGVTADILPPKKVIGNKDESFIEKRRQGLEAYLSAVVRFLQKTMPKTLAIFLNFDKFDILFIVKDLAIKFFNEGETILSRYRHYSFTPLQIYAISERIKKPCTNLDLLDQREDFSHVLDFCCQLSDVTIVGSDVVIPNSNIIPNSLPLQFNVFKTLNHLTLKKINCNSITDVGSLRITLKIITVYCCNVNSLSSIFLCDQIHKNNIDVQHEWKNIQGVSISQTQIVNIDESISLVPNVDNLLLEDNRIDTVINLQNLKQLTTLNLRNNKIYFTDTFELNIVNLVHINLSQNFITTLKPFSKLFSLETLNLQSNQVKDIEEVAHVVDLPSLENFVLSGNPVSLIVDYRAKVLVMFGSRAFRICLDNESTNQKELDKVAILNALRSSKQGLPYVNITS